MSSLQDWAKKANGDVEPGGYILAPGPGHSARDRSMKIWPGPDDLARVHSFAGDPWQTCKDYIRDLGIPVSSAEREESDNPPARRRPAPKPPIQPHEGALHLWRAARPGAEAEVLQAYLRHRWISIEAPPSIRLHPACPYFDQGGPGAADYIFPALIGGVQLPDRKLVAIQRTYLAHDGSGKAPVTKAKKALGCLGAGAIRLAPAAPAIGLVEGIEDGLSVMEMAGIGCWAVLGAKRFSAVELPPEVQEVHVYAQNDPSGVSQAEAEKAAAKFKRQGRRAFIHLPAFDLPDWNDALQSERRGY